MNRRFHSLFFFLVILALIIPAYAHVPLNAGDNNRLETATPINNPGKSWVIYSHLHDAGDVAYYKLQMNAGQKLTVSLMTNGFDGAVADLVIISPEEPHPQPDILSEVEIPAGSTAELIKGQKPVQADYEPFSPSAIFEAASYKKDITTPGAYYIAVVAPANETDYSIAVGYIEEFSPSEWLMVPVNVIGIHVWEGQSPFVVLAPCIALVLLGVAFLLWQQKRRGIHRSLFSWCAILAGLLYLGGATITLTQMVRALSLTGFSPSCMVTLIFAAIPIALGVWALRTGMRTPHPLPVSARIPMGVIGLIGLLFWAGLIIGPVIAFVAAIVPAGIKK
jgi:hypothetical protein